MFRARACISSETVVWSLWNLYSILNLSVYAALLHLKRIILYLNFQISYKEVVKIWKMGGGGGRNHGLHFNQKNMLSERVMYILVKNFSVKTLPFCVNSTSHETYFFLKVA